MNVDITNHLIPWTQVKVMIQEAKREAWEEGEEDGAWNFEHIAVIERGIRAPIANPYAEDA